MHYENQILDAIETIVDSKIKNAGYDKTIQATILNCEDATIGKYKVSHQDSIFYAYTNSSTVRYSKGAEVYVLVPNGDMSLNKTILGAVDKLGIDYATVVQGETAYEIIGVNCIDSHAEFNLCSYETTLARVIYDRRGSDNPLVLNIKNLENYLKEATSVILAATVKTDLPREQQLRGNYGIVYQMVFTDNGTGEEVTRNYILDINQFEGNPYNLVNYKRQVGIFDIDGQNFKHIEKIYLFCYDFPNQSTGEPADIFIKDLELYGSIPLTESDLNGFKLSFIAPQGTYFDDTDGEKATRLLEAKVRIKGEFIDSRTQILPYYWFVEDNRVNTSSEYYNSYGGQGWRCINQKNIIQTTPETIVEWVPGSYQLNITKENSPAKETRYKCVAIYNEILLSREITITNYSSHYDITIESDSGTEFYYDIGNPTLTCKVNGNEETGSAYTYQWAEVDNNGIFYSLVETTTDNAKYDAAAAGYANLMALIEAGTAMPAASQARLDSYLTTMEEYDRIRRVKKNKVYHAQINVITNFTMYKCSVYHNGTYVGTARIVLTNRLDQQDIYRLIVNDGVQTFKYNEAGVAPTSSALENPQTIPALSFTIYDNNGKALTDEILRGSQVEWQVPAENTLIVLPSGYSYEIENGYKIIKNSKELTYEIQPKYDVSKTNNNIRVVVQYKDMTLMGQTDLTFSKEGEPGTNGTEFLCRIVPNSNVPLDDYPMLINGVPNYTRKQGSDSKEWFRLEFWHSGVLIFSGIKTDSSTVSEEGKNIQVEWEILINKYDSEHQDASSISVTQDGKFTYNSYKAENSSPADIVKCTVVYDDVEYYCTLPLITAKTNNGYGIKLTKNTGFRFATYSADGLRPKFDNSNPFTIKVTKKINGYDEDISTIAGTNSVSYTWTRKGTIYNRNKKAFENSLNILEWNRSAENYPVAKNQKWFKPVDRFDGECVTNSVECVVKSGSTIVARINMPIHLLLNKYGHAALNGWDGNHISIGENGTGAILAPQLGAGKKVDGNGFTGLFMGTVKEANSTSADGYTGLHGYNDGIRTLFLNAENGSAIFGRQGTNQTGQIVIDPTLTNGKANSKIYSSNFWKTYGDNGLPSSYGSGNENGQGLLIDLVEPEIRFGNGNFKVDENGHLTAKGGGSIAGWKISDTRLSSNNGNIYLDSSATGSTTMLKIGRYFSVTANGGLTATDAYIDGEIYAEEGEIGGWTINSTNITGGDTTLYSTGAITVGDNFYVDKNGYLEASNAVLSGYISSTEGYIGGWAIGSNYLSGGGAFLNSDTGTLTLNGYAGQDFIQIYSGSTLLGHIGIADATAGGGLIIESTYDDLWIGAENRRGEVHLYGSALYWNGEELEAVARFG